MNLQGLYSPASKEKEHFLEQYRYLDWKVHLYTAQHDENDLAFAYTLFGWTATVTSSARFQR